MNEIDDLIVLLDANTAAMKAVIVLLVSHSPALALHRSVLPVSPWPRRLARRVLPILGAALLVMAAAQYVIAVRQRPELRIVPPPPPVECAAHAWCESDAGVIQRCRWVP